MRPLFTILSAVLLTAALAAATSTTPTTLNASLIPKTCLASNAAGTSFATALCTGAAPSGMSFTGTEARWNASQADLGWDYLEVAGANFRNAGILEGMLTAQRISYYMGAANQASQSAATKTWIQKHIAFMQNGAVKNPFSEFWSTVGAILQQVEGLAVGYNQATPSATPVTMYDMFLLSFVDEVGDVDIAVNLAAGKLNKDELLKPRQIGSHCSALIKTTKDDLFVAHDTWDVFSGSAHRIYKKYSFGRTITMSSYPGQVVSNDDWYQISNPGAATALNMAVQETTNEVFNTSLYTAVVPETVSEFIRVMTANYLATSAEQWTDYFARHNSGTYNNQYMVVDFELYVPGSNVVPNTFWIAEQIPGLVQRGDMSGVLNSKGYWASYNVPYFYNIFDLSGYKAMEAKVGTFWSYAKYARPEIFKRNETDVHDLSTMMKMMRYNNYKSDPLSIIPNCTGADAACATKHSSMLTIASRGDLMPLFNTTAEMIRHYGPLYSFVAQGCFGAIDSKIANWKNRNSMTNHVVSGPTNDQQPTFSYPTAVCPKAPAGSPTTFDFPWLKIIN